jgi:hypothetical protein
MQISIVESSWRSGDSDETSSRYSTRPLWSSFGEVLAYDAGVFDTTMSFGTAYGVEGIRRQVQRFVAIPGPGVLVIGAHGESPRARKRHLSVRARDGRNEQVGWDHLSQWIRKAETADPASKLVLFDSCSFLANSKDATRFLRETNLGGVAGFARDVEVFASVVIEQAFLSWLLAGLDGDGAPDDWLTAPSPPDTGEFPRRYKSLIKEFRFRALRRESSSGKVTAFCSAKKDPAGRR